MKTINEIMDTRTLAMVTGNWNEYKTIKNTMEAGRTSEKFLMNEVRKVTGEKVGIIDEMVLTGRERNHIIHDIKKNGSAELKAKLFKYLRESNR